MGGVITLGIGCLVGKLVHDKYKRAKRNIIYSQEQINKAYRDRVNELNKKEKELLNKEREIDKRIKDMEKQIQNQKNLYEKMKMEYEIKIFEQMQKEEQKKIKEIQERQIAINQCKDYLTEELIKSIIKSYEEYGKIEENLIKQITENEKKNRIKEFLILFSKLFDSEKIKNKITNKFIEQINKNYPKEELKKMNFMIIGASGVGKSTLINALLGEDLAKEGMGGVCTTEIRKYESKNYPFICLYDSVGAELGNNHTLENIQNETINVIVEQLNNPDPNQHIHCIIYCVTFNRFYEEELKIILKIRAKYDGNKLPIVIAYTMGNENEKVIAIKEKINEYLKKYKESIDDDMLTSYGINYLKLYAKEDIITVSDKKHFQKCFGLSNLISICYKKGEKIYKIAIKNSLIQIANEYFLTNIENISNKIENDINLFLFLDQNFEPNFPDFISFLFEKIAYVDNFDNVNFDNLYKLNNAYNNTLNFQDIKEDNYFEIILKSNLNYNSKNEITKSIERYKNEMLKILKIKFDNFIEENSEKIYIDILEKFNEQNKSKYNVGEAMKSKSQLKKEANESIRIGLKEIAEENFLKYSASLLFKDIIKIFKEEMNKQIHNFMINLESNEDIQKLLKPFDILEPNKGIEIGKDFKKYIEFLKVIEKKSYEKSLTYKCDENLMFKGN